jgi:hypothetical protein
MRRLDTAIKDAEDEIVFALRKQQTISATTRQIQSEFKERARLPLPTENRDLETAIDDMIERFPKTLEYLAK